MADVLREYGIAWPNQPPHLTGAAGLAPEGERDRKGHFWVTGVCF
jgi:hypothetical protein